MAEMLEDVACAPSGPMCNESSTDLLTRPLLLFYAYMNFIHSARANGTNLERRLYTTYGARTSCFLPLAFVLSFSKFPQNSTFIQT
jgi:hypothetical protein